MCLFKVVSIWKRMKVPKRKLQRRFKYFFGKENKVIDDRTKAIEMLRKIITTVQNEMIERIKNDGTYETLLKIYYIFDEIHSIYLSEKEFRVNVLKYGNNGNSEIVDILLTNSKIERNIIDASNIWLENCLLFQHDLDIDQLNIKKFLRRIMIY